MSLCKELGGMTYEEMLGRMSSKEVVKWMAYNELDIENMNAKKMEYDVKQTVKRK